MEFWLAMDSLALMLSNGFLKDKWIQWDTRRHTYLCIAGTLDQAEYYGCSASYARIDLMTCRKTKHRQSIADLRQSDKLISTESNNMNLKRHQLPLTELPTVLATDADKLIKLHAVLDGAINSWAARQGALYDAFAIEGQRNQAGNRHNVKDQAEQ